MMRSDLIHGSSTPQPMRLRFSVDEYYKMYELGLLKDFERSEIIDGELITKTGIGDRHAAVVNFLNRIFSKSVSDSVLISVQNPLRLDDFDEPEPDIVLADLTKYDGKRHPRPAETILVVEVAEASLKYDRGDKLARYAKANIPEVWVINLPSDLIEVHKDPDAGIYQTAKIFRMGETVISKALPELSLRVDDLLA